jgi:hypothetical protein
MLETRCLDRSVSCTCSQCGRDLSSFEHYLDNGFGFEVSDDGVHVQVVYDSDPARDFKAFVIGQFANFSAWINEVSETFSDAEAETYATRSVDAFLCGIEQVAKEHHIEGYTWADLFAGIYLPALIVFRQALDRVGSNAPFETIAMEAARIACRPTRHERRAGRRTLARAATFFERRGRSEIAQSIRRRLYATRRQRWNLPRNSSVRRPRTRRASRSLRRARAPARKGSDDSAPEEPWLLRAPADLVSRHRGRA